jgi:hypothetical protein
MGQTEEMELPNKFHQNKRITFLATVGTGLKDPEGRLSSCEFGIGCERLS